MSARKYFGTDGIRGRVGQGPISADFVLRLGNALGRVLGEDGRSRPTVLIGKDTRISGYMFEAALEAGLVAAGADVQLIGPMPTPAIAFPHQYAARRCRHRHQCLAQSALRQRHQVLFRRGREARRCH